MEPTPDDVTYLTKTNPRRAEVRRIVMERAIIRQLVGDAIEQGFYVSLWDGGATPVEYSRDLGSIMDAIMSAEDDELIFYKATKISLEDHSKVYTDRDPLSTSYGRTVIIRRDAVEKREYETIGRVLLVYGNDGYDVMADSSGGEQLSLITAGADALAEKLEEEQ